MAVFEPSQLRAHLKRAAKMGRNGDTLLGHYTKGDVVIPIEEIDDKTRGQLKKILGDRLDRFTAGDKANSINPKTKLPEFMDGGAGGGDSGGGGGDSNGGSDTNGTSGTDANSTAGASDAQASGTGGLGSNATGAGPSSNGIGLSGGVDTSNATADAAAPGFGIAADQAIAAAPGPNPEVPGSQDISISRTGEDISPDGGFFGALNTALAQMGINTKASLTSHTGTIGDIFGNVAPAGLNTNAIGTGIGLVGQATGIPGMGTLANVSGLSSLANDVFGLGLASPGYFGGGLFGTGNTSPSNSSSSGAAGAGAAAGSGAAGTGAGGAGAGSGAEGGHSFFTNASPAGGAWEFGGTGAAEHRAPTTPGATTPSTSHGPAVTSPVPGSSNGATSVAVPGNPTNGATPVAIGPGNPITPPGPPLSSYLAAYPHPFPFSMAPGGFTPGAGTANNWWQNFISNFAPSPYGGAPRVPTGAPLGLAA